MMVLLVGQRGHKFQVIQPVIGLVAILMVYV
jgi:hypothetical protein